MTLDEWQGKAGKFDRHLKKPQWDFKPRGKSGIEVSMISSLHIGDCIDDICIRFVRCNRITRTITKPR